MILRQLVLVESELLEFTRLAKIQEFGSTNSKYTPSTSCLPDNVLKGYIMHMMQSRIMYGHAENEYIYYLSHLLALRVISMKSRVKGWCISAYLHWHVYVTELTEHVLPDNCSLVSIPYTVYRVTVQWAYTATLAKRNCLCYEATRCCAYKC